MTRDTRTLALKHFPTEARLVRTLLNAEAGDLLPAFTLTQATPRHKLTVTGPAWAFSYLAARLRDLAACAKGEWNGAAKCYEKLADKFAAAAPVTEEPVTVEPVTVEPVTVEPVTEEPAAPVTEEPAYYTCTSDLRAPLARLGYEQAGGGVFVPKHKQEELAAALRDAARAHKAYTAPAPATHVHSVRVLGVHNHAAALASHEIAAQAHKVVARLLTLAQSVTERVYTDAQTQRLYGSAPVAQEPVTVEPVTVEPVTVEPVELGTSPAGVEWNVYPRANETRDAFEARVQVARDRLATLHAKRAPVTVEPVTIGVEGERTLYPRAGESAAVFHARVAQERDRMLGVTPATPPTLHRDALAHLADLDEVTYDYIVDAYAEAEDRALRRTAPAEWTEEQAEECLDCSALEDQDWHPPRTCDTWEDVYAVIREAYERAAS